MYVIVWPEWYEIFAKVCVYIYIYIYKTNMYIYIYIHIYLCMPDGGFGDRFFSKTGRFGARVFRNIKIGISEEKCGNSKKGKNHKLLTSWGKSSVL